MAEVNWTQAARDDVASIADFIAKDSLHYARIVVKKITDLSQNLIQNPYSGRIVPELEQEDIRERFIYSYRLIYLVKGKDVLVLAVIHGSRLLEPEEGRILTDASD